MTQKRGSTKHVPYREVGAKYAWNIWRDGKPVRRVINMTQREAIAAAEKMNEEERNDLHCQTTQLDDHRS